jgi:hypothetical protein
MIGFGPANVLAVLMEVGLTADTAVQRWRKCTVATGIGVKAHVLARILRDQSDHHRRIFGDLGFEEDVVPGKELLPGFYKTGVLTAPGPIETTEWGAFVEVQFVSKGFSLACFDGIWSA